MPDINYLKLLLTYIIDSSCAHELSINLFNTNQHLDNRLVLKCYYNIKKARTFKAVRAALQDLQDSGSYK